MCLQVGSILLLCREWLQEAQEHCNVPNFEVFLVATKRDLVVSEINTFVIHNMFV